MSRVHGKHICSALCIRRESVVLLCGGCAMSGAERTCQEEHDKALLRKESEARVKPAICLRACHAIPLSAYDCAMRCPVLTWRMVPQRGAAARVEVCSYALPSRCPVLT
eukprot:3533815-Rhodomonas_salina.2